MLILTLFICSVIIYFLIRLFFKKNVKLIAIALLNKDIERGIKFLLWYYKIHVYDNKHITYKIINVWLNKWNTSDKFEEEVKKSLLTYLNKNKKDKQTAYTCACIYSAIKNGVAS